MAMKCSVLGHKFGPEKARTETTAEENGDIETLQRVRECTRCDHEKVVSENKQVRPDPEPVATDGGELDEAPEVEQSDDVSAEPTTTDDAIILDDSAESDGDGSDAEDAEDAEAPSGSSYQTRDLDPNEEGVAFIENRQNESESSEDPAPDDGPTDNASAVIIEDSSGSDDASDETTADELEDPSGFDGASDAVFIDSGDDESDAQESDVETVQEAYSTESDGSSSDDSGRVLVCPECSHRVSQSQESRWAGDACPECRAAFLERCDG